MRYDGGPLDVDPKSRVMVVEIPLPCGLGLVMSEGPLQDGTYATRQLQHGFRLTDLGQDLSEEAVGFGLPVIKRGLRTLFPGTLALTSEHAGSVWRVQAQFTFNLEERLSRGSSPGFGSRSIYVAKDFLAAIIRRIRPVRGLLTGVSSGLRTWLGLRTVYDEVGLGAGLQVQYVVDSAKGEIQISLDASPLAGQGVTEVILMNEQGGRFFDVYRDSAGRILRGGRIGAWDRVTASEASMVSSTRRIAFSVTGGDGARLYRGREVVGSRLAWSGFGFSFPPALGKLEYAIRIAGTS
jgi:hypothetical protein